MGNRQVSATKAIIPASLLGCSPERPVPVSLPVPLSVPSPGQNCLIVVPCPCTKRGAHKCLLMRKDPLLFSASTFLLNRNGNHSEHRAQAWSPAWTTPYLVPSYSPLRDELQHCFTEPLPGTSSPYQARSLLHILITSSQFLHGTRPSSQLFSYMLT